jgi:hypothetical protein
MPVGGAGASVADTRGETRRRLIYAGTSTIVPTRAAREGHPRPFRGPISHLGRGALGDVYTQRAERAARRGLRRLQPKGRSAPPPSLREAAAIVPSFDRRGRGPGRRRLTDQADQGLSRDAETGRAAAKSYAIVFGCRSGRWHKRGATPADARRGKPGRPSGSVEGHAAARVCRSAAVRSWTGLGLLVALGARESPGLLQGLFLRQDLGP